MSELFGSNFAAGGEYGSGMTGSEISSSEGLEAIEEENALADLSIIGAIPGEYLGEALSSISTILIFFASLGPAIFSSGSLLLTASLIAAWEKPFFMGESGNDGRPCISSISGISSESNCCKSLPGIGFIGGKSGNKPLLSFLFQNISINLHADLYSFILII